MAQSKGKRVKITWSIDEELVMAVKHTAIDRREDASTLVEQALRKFLGK